MVHGLETIAALNARAIEQSNRKYGGGPPVPPLRVVREEVKQPEPPKRLEMDYPSGMLRAWRFCDPDATRFALGFVRVDFQKGVLQAADGRVAVSIPFEITDDFAQCLPVLLWAKSLESIFEYSIRMGGLFRMRLVNEGDLWFAQDADVRFALLTDNGRFPNFESIFKHVAKESFTFTVNMRLLANFCNAFKNVDNANGEPGVEIQVPLDGTALTMRCGTPAYGDAVDARLMLMGDEGKPVVKLNRSELVWRKATAEDCGRLARFRKHGEDSFAYGLLIAVEHSEFHCKWSENNEMVGIFDLCEVQQ